jgi:hypothetical protein
VAAVDLAHRLRRPLWAAAVAALLAALGAGPAAADGGSPHGLLRRVTGGLAQTAAAPAALVDAATQAVPVAPPAVPDTADRVSAVAEAAGGAVQAVTTPVAGEAEHVLSAPAQALAPRAAVKVVGSVAAGVGATVAKVVAPADPPAATEAGSAPGASVRDRVAPVTAHAAHAPLAGGSSSQGAGVPASGLHAGEPSPVAALRVGPARIGAPAGTGPEHASGLALAASSAGLPSFAPLSGSRGEATVVSSGGRDGGALRGAGPPVQAPAPGEGGFSSPSLSASGAGVALALVLTCLTLLMLPSLSRRLRPPPSAAREVRLLLLLERPG